MTLEGGTKVRIPPGVGNGARIRVPGKGRPAPRGGEPGDLYVRVHVHEHPIFIPEGKGNLRVVVPVTYPEAALGGKIQVPTLDGAVTVKIPPGTTTGRRRRCGWLDMVSLRHAVRVNSVSSIMLNKLDILAGLPEVKACVAYRVDGELIEDWPVSLARLERAEPVYETFAGWREELSHARSIDDLPLAARRFVEAIEEHAGVPIAIVSVGPERNQTLVRTAAGNGTQRTTSQTAGAAELALAGRTESGEGRLRR
jgi:hypothetical protein